MVFEGERIQIDLEMRKLDRGADRGDGCRIYGSWRIPDRPEVPRRLRGATTRIRHNSTKEEVAENRRRTRALRAIAPGTDAFNELFGIREDAESMHSHLKSRLINRRARSTGVIRKQLNLHATRHSPPSTRRSLTRSARALLSMSSSGTGAHPTGPEPKATRNSGSGGFGAPR